MGTIYNKRFWLEQLGTLQSLLRSKSNAPGISSHYQASLTQAKRSHGGYQLNKVTQPIPVSQQTLETPLLAVYD